MGNIYEYQFSAEEPREDFRRLLIEELTKAGLKPIVTGECVSVKGEGTFEKSMMYMARFLHYDRHSFTLKLKGGEQCGKENAQKENQEESSEETV